MTASGGHPTKIKLSTRSLRSQQPQEMELTDTATDTHDHLPAATDPDLDEPHTYHQDAYQEDDQIQQQAQAQLEPQNVSGSEFGDEDIPEPEQSDYDDDLTPPPKRAGRTSTRRAPPKKRAVEEEYQDDGSEYESDEYNARRSRPTRGRPSTRSRVHHFVQFDGGDGDDEEFSLRGNRRRLRNAGDDPPEPVTRSSRQSRSVVPYFPPKEVIQERHEKLANERADRAERRRTIMYTDDEDDDSPERRNYSLRTRRERPNYVLPPPVLDVRERPEKIGRLPSFTALQHPSIDLVPWNRRGGLDDSDTDDDLSPRKRPQPAPANLAGGGGGLLAPGEGMGMDNLGTGGPSNLGKIGDAAFADTDPLGVNTKISFESIGGLDEHIRQLKEMVSLPLLYPEVFQRFSITPPRGVLFHGPPGTGKTLIARALAASCSSENQKISFFMRKGADCLSKWIGEAERQLRLLFDEAKACQPSIIFFDEIDGLAPVRSSKQEQIHASIVSTLLALMDGMDGRGQVIVIGATNRPDAVDPALRRPGRFDREFYFPLPNEKARSKIIEINTKDWNPPLEPQFLDKLANLTKGYGGADIRALCTEAALNAVQRRYPQIYKTNDRLLLDPKSINVQAKDFMRSINKLTPSSARSSATSAAPLPHHLTPLLGGALDESKKVVDKVIPRTEEKSVIEEAEYEDDVGEDGGFSLEVMRQNMNSMRTFRPRMMVYGEEGMGQAFIGPALLHYLEGYNVQSLDLATLLSDSTRTVEAACVQLILEAKRTKPSIIYIPALHEWCNVISEAARATVTALLNTISPSDPILVLAMLNNSPDELPRDVKRWFGFGRDSKVALNGFSEEQITEYLMELINMIKLKPSQFPDTGRRKKRKLEILPVAPPMKPREPTDRELNALLENDARIREHLKWRLGAVLEQLKKKFRRFMKSFADEIAMVLPLPVNTHNNGSVNALARSDLMADNDNQQPQTQHDSEAKEQDEDEEEHAKEQPNDQDKDTQVQPMTNGVVDGDVLEYDKVSDEAGADEVKKDTDHVQTGDQQMEQTEEPVEGSPEKEDEENDDAIDEEMADFIQPPQAANKEISKDSEDDEPIIEDKNDDDFEPDEEEEEAPQEPDLQPVPPKPEANLQENMEKSLDEELMELSTIQPGEDHRTRLMIYDIDLEKIHFNVYKDNYVNPAQFVDDVAKIVHNAELDPSDQDRLWKAQQLLTHARVLVDQAFDGPFRIECQRMADRETKRIAEYKEKRKREKEASKNVSEENEAGAADGEQQEQPEQQTRSEEQDQYQPQQDGIAAAAPEQNDQAEQSEQSENGTSLKRPREGEGDGDGENGGDGPETKKAKGDVEMTESSQPIDTSQKEEELQEAPKEASQAPKSPTPESEPEPEPEFLVDESQLTQLLNEAVALVKDFNADELEQTRANISSVIWQHREEWNRQSTIEAVRSALHSCKYDVDM
ncbi:hypothetical protein E3P91_00714 [Wallemia ichthyophaga]|nr:hypothetical protein E3P91_00714 [Wallemia ichthyophaga]TIB66355.1 hypothetical protein E3P78_00014 [Wallemia ichthyophaga]